MKHNYIIIAMIIWSCIPCHSQSFTLHSNLPFGMQLAEGTLGVAASQFFFYDIDQDGDQDLFLSGLDYFDNVSQPDWENLHFFFKMQLNTGDKHNPQFADPVDVSDNFPFPVGYFAPSMGDLNADGMADMIVSADIDAIGNQSVLQLTGLPANEWDVKNLDTAGLYPFAPESFFRPDMVDLDLDGDLDLMMSGFESAFAEENGPDVPQYFYARNVGTSSNPIFEGWYQNPYGLMPNPFAETLTSGDIDNDGDVDLLGVTIFLPADSVSYIHMHVNAPVAGKPNFAQSLNSPFGLPVLNGTNQFLSPDLVDIDGDGDLDFFVIELGSDTSFLWYYENALCVPEQSELEVSICEGDAYEFGGLTYTDPGVYFVVLEGTDGCDSTVVLTLDIIPITEVNFEQTLCAGEIIVIGGEVFELAGNYTILLQGTNGCDSIINLSLVVLPEINTSLTEMICSGEVFVIGGDTISDAGEYAFILEAANGCDSIVLLSLSVDIVDNSVTLTGSTLTSNLSNALYQWFDCDTGEDVPFASGQSFTPVVTGNYGVRITDEFGCTAESECTLVVITSTSEDGYENQFIIYPNPADERFYVMNRGGIKMENVMIMDMFGRRVGGFGFDEVGSIDVSGLASGVYLMRFEVSGVSVVRKVVVE